MANIYFMTGFPGFLATKMVEYISEQEPKSTFYLLVHPSQVEKADTVVKQFEENSRFTILQGDITKENLGLKGIELDRVTHVFHFAAIYDLAVALEVAELVNVTGTERVLNWLETLPSLKRFVYFSTAYVSGDRVGTVYEDELVEGQGFKNHYESTKYEAEILVQGKMESIPTTIIRPGIVVGHSQTGETVKFDGPYFIMRFLDKFSRLPIPYIGHGRVPVYLVPVDYILEAVYHFTHLEKSEGKVYHLTDPNPSEARALYKEIVGHLLNKQPTWFLPTSFVSGMLRISKFRRWVQVERETIDYFQCETYYDTTNTINDLQGSGIECPTFNEYAGNIVKYYKEARHDQDKAVPVK
ncbi:SDR family oxidoreductase [Pseudalkalibacillus berkeleyi]|uniref:SDR family oxidoreductase n=1 Tax=Pseudalkalibacillus berkeleyi TaxID=1069813 RepID=A0ABS9GWU1_9BACL|nr:SDR family oxidoreductase [Pseudalkalibacillus berkeleyi]MCF6136140.1 SDR family oxidoreductase [Pseudalkalibacillus berkeleyi]